MAFPARSSPLPPPSGREAGVDTGLGFRDERASESRLYAAAPTVSVVAADGTLRDSLSALIQDAGRAVGGAEIISVAAVVITDATSGAESTVARLRVNTRSDAAIIVIVAASAPTSEIDASYKAGAALCLRSPADEHQLLAAIDSAIDLQTAKVHADDLMRQLDVQAHLASLGRVTAGFTHEVSSPLSALALNFEIMRDNVAQLLQARGLLEAAVDESDPSVKTKLAMESLSHISSCGDLRGALGDMEIALDRLNGVLAAARALAQEGLSRHIEDVDLTSLVQDVRRWAAQELEGIEVQELIDEPVVARADPRLLRQVVLNLLTNAANAVRPLPSPRVRLHVYESNETAILSVRDNGPGIPPEVRDRIFEPFFTTRRSQGGTGLGLALCWEYTAQMKAQISLWTAPGRGACFRVHMGMGRPKR